LRLIKQVYLTIAFKYLELQIAKQSSNSVKVKWPKPSTSYDSISLICTIENVEFRTDYNNKETEGLCSRNKSISGQPIDIYTLIKKNQVEFVASELIKYVVGPYLAYIR
jgi:hypothetical protein